MNLSPLHFPIYRLVVVIVGFLSLANVVCVSALAQKPSFTLEAGVEFRYFPEKPAFKNQISGLQPSLMISGDGKWISDNRKKRIKFEPFLRLDGRDSERTYFDIRELSYSQNFGNFDILAGVGQIFWGVAESRNIVDVINQFDIITNSNETDKFGQPMFRLGKFFNFGRLEAYYLPYFRKRIFPSKEGRHRASLVVDNDSEDYERDGEEFAGDFALRYANQIGDFDVGLHSFFGTNRNPFLKPNNTNTKLTALYQRLAQAGVDIQWTKDEWLLKFEAIGARSGGDDYLAVVAGYEYTFFGITDDGLDLGILTEYLYDDRDEKKTALSIFENDIFIGARLTWNDIADSELLGGSIIDVDTGASLTSIEYQRRIADAYLLEIEGQYITSPADDRINDFDKDSNLVVRLTKFF